ncbi:MAG: hypothetical protein ABH986_03855 [archaeon]
MAEKETFGIHILFPAFNSTYFRIRFVMGKGFKSKTFVSDRRTRKAVRKELTSFNRSIKKFGVNPVDSRELGTIILSINNGTAKWENYSPFADVESLAGKGIANLLELIVIKELKRRFPDLRYFMHESARDKRRKQLKKRKVIPENSGFFGSLSYSYTDAVKKLEMKIKQDTRKAKEKRTRIIRLSANQKKPKLRRTQWLMRKAA